LSPLTRKLLRDLRAHSAQAAAVIVLAFLGVMVPAELLPVRQLGRLDLTRVIKERAG